MSQHQVAVDAALTSTKAIYRDISSRDVLSALNNFKDLHPSTDHFEFPSAGRRNALVLNGTIPVNIRGSTYNIPIRLYMWDKHPYYAPICFVKPTADMQVKPSQNVDQSGRVFLPYLNQWSHPSHNTTELLQMLVMTFQENCPVYASSSSVPPPPARPYPTYNQATTNQYGQPQPYPVHPQSTQSLGGAAPYTSATTSSSAASPSGTIKPEHIRASLLSAVEHRLRMKMHERVGIAYAELQSVRRTRDELSAGEQKLKALQQQLGAEADTLDATKTRLTSKRDEIQKVLASVPQDDQINLDEAIGPNTPLHRQLFKCYTEDAALEDAIYYLGQALKHGHVPLDAYLKHVRSLSRRQFVSRATMRKCRTNAGLNV